MSHLDLLAQPSAPHLPEDPAAATLGEGQPRRPMLMTLNPAADLLLVGVEECTEHTAVDGVVLAYRTS